MLYHELLRSSTKEYFWVLCTKNEKVFNGKVFFSGNSLTCYSYIDRLHLKYIERNNDSVRKLNPLSANPTKWSTNCLSVFDHFVILALKELRFYFWMTPAKYIIFISFIHFFSFGVVRKPADVILWIWKL